jgi:DNA-binding NarL/FixJ family response regulator
VAAREVHVMEERVLLVAQSPVLRIGIQAVLEARKDYCIIAEAENGLQATALAASHEPTLAIIQDALRGVSGVVAGRAVHEVSHQTRVVVLTDEIDEERIVAAVVHGVDALLPAAIDGSELIAALGRLCAGERSLEELVLSRPEIAARVFDEARAVATGEAPIRSSALSGREIAILDGVVRGMSNREIAAGLFVVEQTVKNHMTSLLRKLSAGDRTEAVVSAVRTGMIDLGAQLPVPPPQETSSMFSAA